MRQIKKKKKTALTYEVAPEAADRVGYSIKRLKNKTYDASW